MFLPARLAKYFIFFALKRYSLNANHLRFPQLVDLTGSLSSETF